MDIQLCLLRKNQVFARGCSAKLWHLGACGWIQIIFWQAGDVGIQELKDTLKEFAERVRN